MAIYEPPDTIDKEIYSLVKLLNQTGYIRTTSSCAGFTPLEDGTYRRHSEEAYPWISFEPNGASQACAHLLEYVSKRLANAHDRGIRPSEIKLTNLNSDARRTLHFYEQADAENLFWLDDSIFYIQGALHILPILKEGETKSLHQWGIEKPFGIVRTMEDIRKICQLIEMAAREFEGESPVQVPVCHSLEEQIQSLETFLRSLPYLFVKRPNRSIQALMNGAIYVVGHIVAGSMEAQAHWFYPRLAAFARHIAMRLYNGYAPQMHFCTGNIFSLQEIPKAVTPHRFYKEANALSLLESPLPLVRIHHHFMFGPNHFAFGPNSMVLTPPDLMKVWQLLEMAVREFIEANEIHIP